MLDRVELGISSTKDLVGVFRGGGHSVGGGLRSEESSLIDCNNCGLEW